jgi:hypothetical protein
MAIGRPCITRACFQANLGKVITIENKKRETTAAEGAALYVESRQIGDKQRERITTEYS